MCTHIADIDYETIITYNGGYDDMVLQKTSVRTRIESQNEQREKKIAQLNDFIARFSAGTRSSQVNSRKKEVERLATSELARSNIARPFIAFKMERPSGKTVLEFENVNKSYTQKDGKIEHVINNFSGAVMRGDKVILMGRNGQGKTTLLKALLANGPGIEEKDVSIDSGAVKWGHEVADRLLRAGPQGLDPAGHDGGATGCTSSIRRRPRKTFAASWGRCCSAAKRV